MRLEIYLTILHCMTVLNLPVAAFSFYIVFRHSPKSMHKSYRSLLLLHVLMVATCDFCMTVLATPVVLAPIIGFYMKGVLELLGIPTLAQFSFLISCIMVTCVSVDLLFHFRFDVILPHNHHLKMNGRKRLIFYTASVIFFATVPSVVLLFMFPPTEEMRQIKSSLARTYVEMELELAQEQTVAISIDTSLYVNLVYIVTVVALVIILSTVAFFIIHAIRTIKSMSNHMSAETKRQSLHFLRALITQSGIHSAFLVSPLIVVCVFQMRFDYYNRDLTNSLVTLFSIHGTLGLITMLCVTDPYREAICGYSSKGLPKVTTQTTEVTVATTQTYFRRSQSILTRSN